MCRPSFCSLERCNLSFIRRRNLVALVADHGLALQQVIGLRDQASLLGGVQFLLGILVLGQDAGERILGVVESS